MGNPCGTVHMPNFPCRECDRLRKKASVKNQAKSDPGRSQSPAVDIQSTGVGLPDTHVADDQKQPSMEEGGPRPLTNAERQKKHREKDLDEYRKWNRERMARKRSE